MSLSTPLVAIVDAYSSGHLLPHWFRANGYDCVHVSSNDFVERHLKGTFRQSDFCATLLYRGEFEQAVKELQQFGVAAVVAGCETGVLLADALASRLDVPGNGLTRSAARRDKYLMSKVLRKNGLNAVNGCHAGSVEQGVSWASALGRWPVVAKPCASAGCDSVQICKSDDELARALESIIGRRNKIGVVNEGALVQEYVEGEVYSVNTVSCEGQHYVTHIWKYEKQGILYDHQYLIPFEGEEQSALISYASAVLDAMEIAYGPAHIEMICRGDSPVVVDFGARLHGRNTPALNRECTGVGQDELTADAYVDQESFHRKTASPYHIYKYHMTVDFISNVEGRVASINAFEAIKRLQSYYLLNLNVTVGGEIQRTVDQFTSPGHVDLIHRDPQQLRRDLATIREIEASGLYQVEANTY